MERPSGQLSHYLVLSHYAHPVHYRLPNIMTTVHLGMELDSAGKVDACEGCPNQDVCASGPSKPKVQDPATIPMINERLAGVKQKILVLSTKSPADCQIIWFFSSSLMPMRFAKTTRLSALSFSAVSRQLRSYTAMGHYFCRHLSLVQTKSYLNSMASLINGDMRSWLALWFRFLHLVSFDYLTGVCYNILANVFPLFTAWPSVTLYPPVRPRCDPPVHTTHFSVVMSGKCCIDPFVKDDRWLWASMTWEAYHVQITTCTHSSVGYEYCSHFTSLTLHGRPYNTTQYLCGKERFSSPLT